MSSQQRNLITCAECGRKGVSSSATICPSCGKNPHAIACDYCGMFFARSRLSGGRCEKCEKKIRDQQRQEGVTKCPCCKAALKLDMTRASSLSCSSCGHPFEQFQCSVCGNKILGKPYKTQSYCGEGWSRTAICCKRCAPDLGRWISAHGGGGCGCITLIVATTLIGTITWCARSLGL